ncbi:ATP-binding protein [Algoriphagus sp. AGSA1]|uniref:ATP-binding protein n=1 Tax=Algoriphagus sp. AGSA1 TaxID=2907213 RepID=UPI001F2D51BE|nr:ATP-binding protein [Algoriphagus sp. AGSA1]MCE7053043.1 ATP-binding protein [Algoriphagus sp. AGSA1]
MSRTPVENHADLRIGVVEFIAPDEIKIQLDIEAPDGIAANAGVPREFPRINSYVLIPNEGGHIVCQVEWINIERSPFPKRKGYQDYGLIDLPFPIRKMKVAPLGILKMTSGEKFRFQRGVHSFPSIGSPVLIPTDLQLMSIVESGSNRRVYIGNSPLTANAQVKIDPDRLFGRHLAVLGNTGSGKSCTVAGLMQWSLEATEQGENANARFIILDPNGEYTKVFGANAKVLKVGGEDEDSLEVPLWLWNSEEWRAFTQAKSGAQLPLLKRALRSMRNGELEFQSDQNLKAKKFVGIMLQSTVASENKGEPFQGFPHNKNFTERLIIWKRSLESFNLETDPLGSLMERIEVLIEGHKAEQSNGWVNYSEYTVEEIEILIEETRETYVGLGGGDSELFPKNEDLPIPFSGDVFLSYLEALAQETGNEQYLEFLIARIRTLIGDSRMDSIIGDKTEKELDKWLEKYLGKSEKTSVTIIDLSLVPSEIVHITTSVISRIVFEALQRYRKLNNKVLPSVLVMEEAHSFITRYNDNTEGNSSAICTKAFEKIAREGRKFGLGLVLSSQRPSELSPTVLSQCNSYILHRISNDRDQELVGRLLPDTFRGLLRELPSLPSQKAILLGWASELPILMKVRDLPFEQRPQSDDPDFWDVWIRKNSKGEVVERKVDWKRIANDWQENDAEREIDDELEDFDLL